MKIFHNTLGRVSYKRLVNSEKSENSIITRRLKYAWGFILKLAHSYAAYAFLPVLLLFNFDFIYTFNLQYPIGVISLILFSGVLYSLQDRLLFHPEMPPNSTFYVPFPTHVPYETVEISTSDGEVLRGFFLKTPLGDSSTAPTLLYFHGNAGNAGSPCALPLVASCGVNLLTVDYRGYGKSSGWPSEEGLYLDGKACIEYVMQRSDIDPNKIVLLGHSMGGAIAIHLAAMADDADYRIAALIVENTFTTLPQAASHIFRNVVPGLSNLPFPCYSNKFLSVDKISSVRVPICFICGEKDEIVNPNMTRVLFETCNSPHKVLLRVNNGTHNDTWCVSKHYSRFICAFLGKVFNENLNSDVERGTDTIFGDLSSGMTLTWGCQVFAE